MVNIMYEKCFICKLEKYFKAQTISNDCVKCQCARCGDYIVSDTLRASLEYNQVADFMLSAWIRERKEKGLKEPELVTTNLETIRTQFVQYSPIEKQALFLQAVARKSKYPGDWVEIVPECDFTLCWATSEQELQYYIDAMHVRGLLDWGPNGLKAMITIAGWEYLENFAKKDANKTQAFVAMSFSPEMEQVWENALMPAIKNAGYNPYRIDKNPHNERIDVKIMAEIKKSRFVVADFTGNKHGVYFEVGYALGLGIPVIWAVKKNEITEVHFDTNHYNHIVWGNEKELKDQLNDFITVIIGQRKGVWKE